MKKTTGEEKLVICYRFVWVIRSEVLFWLLGLNSR